LCCGKRGSGVGDNLVVAAGERVLESALGFSNERSAAGALPGAERRDGGEGLAVGPREDEVAVVGPPLLRAGGGASGRRPRAQAERHVGRRATSARAGCSR